MLGWWGVNNKKTVFYIKQDSCGTYHTNVGSIPALSWGINFQDFSMTFPQPPPPKKNNPLVTSYINFSTITAKVKAI